MNITKTVDGTVLTIALEGKLNATASQELDAELSQSLEGMTQLIFDLTNLEYITSAGLRVMLSSYKKMMKLDGMVVRNAGPEILKIFDMTGFASMMNIE